MHRSIRARTGVAAVAAAAGLLGGSALGAAAQPATVAAAPAQQLDVNVGGWAENALVLPDGDVIVSNLDRGILQRIDGGTGQISTIATVAGPGGLARDGNTLYVVTGNSPASAFTRAGGVLAIDLTTGARRTVVSGLGEANGLARLPGGDLVLTVTLGPGTGVHRIAPASGQRRLLTGAIPTPNGIAVGPDGQAYVGSTLLGAIYRVDPDTGARARVAGTSAIVDDFDVRPDGRIVAVTILGFVDELDPVTGRSRPLASGYVGGTSIRLRPGGGAVVTTATGRVVAVHVG